MAKTRALLIEVVRMIPRCQVATYGQIAHLIGVGPRQVGPLLCRPASARVPWHRVVNASGGISLPPEAGGDRQRALLTKEGVHFSRTGRVILRLHRWRGPGPIWLLEHTQTL